jgi:hypothetical protein
MSAVRFVPCSERDDAVHVIPPHFVERDFASAGLPLSMPWGGGRGVGMETAFSSLGAILFIAALWFIRATNSISAAKRELL